jgi:hypothetical protein
MSGYAIGWWMAAGLLLLLVVAAGSSHIVINGSITRKGSDDNADFDVIALFGLLRYHVKVPVLFFENRELKLKAQTEGPVIGVNETETEIDKNAIERFFDRFMDILRFTRDLSGLAKHLLSRVKLTEWRWSTAVGTGDAVSTAMATGLAWSVKTTVTGVLSQLVRLRANPHMEVSPHFNRSVFETTLTCTAKIRAIHLMLAGFRLFGRILKVKGGMQGWLELLKKVKAQPRNA